MKTPSRFAILASTVIVLAGYGIGLLTYELELPPYRSLKSLRAWWSDRGSRAIDASALAALDRRSAPAAVGAPPNVVFIVLDTARADRMSYAGYSRDTTPHIDRFVSDAVVYSDAHSVAPWTLPAHMSMFTGLLPGQHGATWQAFGGSEETTMQQLLARKFELDDPSRLLTVQLKQLGYETLGLSSNAWVSRRIGFDTGFDEFIEMWREYQGLRDGYRDLPAEIRTSWDADQGDAGMQLVQLKRQVLEWEGELEQPFFLFFNFIDPHYPYRAPETWRYKFTNDREIEAAMQTNEISMVAGERPVDPFLLAPYYDSEISYLDFVVGRLLTWLREKGYYDDALIVITSDHGEHLGEQGLFSHQLSVEEELLRVPLIIKYPGNEMAGEVVENPLVSNLDVYETILSAARQGQDPERPTASRDLRDMQAFHRSHLIAEYYYSEPYLQQHRRKVPEFDVAAQRLTRRVVFDSGGRHVFLDPPVEVTDPEPGREEAGRILAGYLQTVESDVLRASDEPIDEEMMERLRALGYVD